MFECRLSMVIAFFDVCTFISAFRHVHCNLEQIKKNNSERSVHIWTDCEPSVRMLKKVVGLEVRKFRNVRRLFAL